MSPTRVAMKLLAPSISPHLVWADVVEGLAAFIDSSPNLNPQQIKHLVSVGAAIVQLSGDDQGISAVERSAKVAVEAIEKAMRKGR